MILKDIVHDSNSDCQWIADSVLDFPFCSFVCFYFSVINLYLMYNKIIIVIAVSYSSVLIAHELITLMLNI